MNTSEIYSKLLELGTPPEAIKFVLSLMDEQAAALERRRSFDRQRKQRQRDKSRDNHVNVTGQSQGQSRDLSPSNGSPPPISSLNIYPPSLTPSHNIQHRKKNRFSEFWLAYPRKIAKGAAEKAWEKAIRIDEPATILKAVRDYKFSDDKEFIPHPATWLNQKRWQDEQNATIVKIEMTEEERKAKIREIWSTP